MISGECKYEINKLDELLAGRRISPSRDRYSSQRDLSPLRYIGIYRRQSVTVYQVLHTFIIRNFSYFGVLKLFFCWFFAVILILWVYEEYREFLNHISWEGGNALFEEYLNYWNESSRFVSLINYVSVLLVTRLLNYFYLTNVFLSCKFLNLTT